MAEQSRRAVVLFQPRDACRTMPLGLLHVGSALAGVRVEVVDGRLELAPEARVSELIRDAICLGVSVPSGQPVAEAFRVTRAARVTRPDLFVVWGGAHPSYRPEQCLVPGGADVCVRGPGEVVFRQIVQCLLEGRAPGPLPGVARREGESVVGPPADPEAHIRDTAAVDYALLDLDRHFRLRGTRGLDYCSSRLAPDGTWQGLPADRVVAEIPGLVRRFRLTEVRMADEEFFGDRERALAIARGLVVSGQRVRWSVRSGCLGILDLDAGEWDLLRASGLGRIHVPLGGGPEAAPSLEPEQIPELAKMLRRYAVTGAFSFLVGRFGEDPQWATRVLDAARSVKQIHRGFETHLRYWAPWPTAREAIAIPGYSEPTAESSWAESELGHGPGGWVPERSRVAIARRDFYQGRAFGPPLRGVAKRLVHWSARARVRTGFFAIDLERKLIGLSERLRGDTPGPEPRADE